MSIRAFLALLISASLAFGQGKRPTDRLELLGDVSITNPTTGQTLTWNGTKWANADASGGGTYDPSAVAIVGGTIKGITSVGIGTASPAVELDVVGSIKMSGGLGVGVTNATAGVIQGGVGIVAGTYPGIAGYISLNGLANPFSEDSVTGLSNNPVRVSGYHGVYIWRAASGTAMATFGSNGYGGVALHPVSAWDLTVQLSSGGKAEINGGDIFLPTTGTGLILVSPNGTKYRVTVEDNGTLTRTALP